MLEDHDQRIEATDPSQSFIVQAPAGSGKTELLTQRFLRLLALVTAPEQIVALTFTRKAASEMRERIMHALQLAKEGVEPNSPHQALTLHYAQAVLNRSDRLSWSIIKQPARLRIMTIDALCQLITHAIPLHEKQVPYAAITDNAIQYYEQAARNCLAYALLEEKLQTAISNLLGHLDNRQDKLIALWRNLLANRDQWLPLLYTAQSQSKAHFEAMLKIIIQHELEHFIQQTPFVFKETICKLARQVSLIESNPKSPRYCLQHWESFDKLDETIVRGLAALLLTSDNKLRRGFDHHVGLKKGNVEDANLYQQLKEQSRELMEALAEHPHFLEALLSAKGLPSPEYRPNQWLVLQALLTLLPYLVGHLQLLFQEKDEVDFTAISHQALLALGEGLEEPTDLSLYLDNRINHLLIDEFQDTSIQQYQLLTQLLSGWEKGDGRTLFLVGDPMQSIYRFRQAEVGLFLKVKSQGIGPITLKPLTLQMNFRSSPDIIHWVNQAFKAIFPHYDDIETGAISFSPSLSARDDIQETAIAAYAYVDAQEEAEAVVKKCAETLAQFPNDNIAILVRSRSQLNQIIATLRAQNIAFQGVEIESISALPHLQDVWALTQLLFMPGNRLAWLSLLRSPFGGVTLSDLHCLANMDSKKSLFTVLSRLTERPCGLSEEGYLRLRYIYQVIHQALATRFQLPLVEWIHQTLKNLHVDAILTPQEQQDLEQFWLLIERFSKNGQYLDLEMFEKEFISLYSKQSVAARLQIMTIHKSKGLEFDTIILPHLSSTTQNKDKPLLRWLNLPRQTNQSPLLLVSPIKASHESRCLLYDYLTALDAKKEAYEQQRLLYVAITRAKKRLYLFDHKQKENTKGSFRHLISTQVFEGTEKQDDNLHEETVYLTPVLRQLPSHYYNVVPKNALVPSSYISLQPFTAGRRLGVLIHELLQWICTYHPKLEGDIPWAFFINRLSVMGLSHAEYILAETEMYRQIHDFMNNPIGQWLSQAHEAEESEYALLIQDKGFARSKVIDRTFVEAGRRWVIDYKTGQNEQASIVNHRKQLNEYAALLSSLHPEPISCGLYYLASADWISWEYQSAEEPVAHTEF